MGMHKNSVEAIKYFVRFYLKRCKDSAVNGAANFLIGLLFGRRSCENCKKPFVQDRRLREH